MNLSTSRFGSYDVGLEKTLIRDINPDSDEEGWQILFYYNIYRLGLTILLLALASPLIGTISLADNLYGLLVPTVGIAAISLVTFINLQRRWPPLVVQAHFLFLLDILFITMLTFSRQLLDSSTLILYVTTASATAVLFSQRVSLLYTLLCAFLIFYNDYVKFMEGSIVIREYYLTPLLVVGLFTVVAIVGRIAGRARSVQSVVAQQNRALEDLDRINQVILEQLDIGVMFLDNKLRIEQINRSARDQIGVFIDENKRIVGDLAEAMMDHIHAGTKEGFNFRIQNREFAFTLLPLSNGQLVQIEDRTQIQKQIQQSKLASIGRMASAISHEIRNPLNAISHAAQLLRPTDNAVDEDTELIQIIRTHSHRIDEIIKSVLERSRPGKPQRKELKLQAWLKVFMDTFRETIDPDQADLTAGGEDAAVLFDPTQLEQVITNLCQNSIKYAKPEGDRLKIHLQVGRAMDGTAILDVVDNGQGVDPEKEDQLFEPFHTSDSRSTGLGLFLVREFCRINGADIEYLRGKTRQGFRITFTESANNVR